VTDWFAYSPIDPSKKGHRRGLIIGNTVLFSILVFAIGSFLQTRDPMILIFGVIAGGTVALVMALVKRGLASNDARPELVKLRCRACQSLNPETARFCNACGKAL
jgi:hypothetical protein